MSVSAIPPVAAYSTPAPNTNTAPPATGGGGGGANPAGGASGGAAPAQQSWTAPGTGGTVNITC